jgi:hypothetical protein
LSVPHQPLSTPSRSPAPQAAVGAPGGLVPPPLELLLLEPPPLELLLLEPPPPPLELLLVELRLLELLLDAGKPR